MFLRLALCNLHCAKCDTPHTWNWTGTPFAHPDKYNYQDEVHDMSETDIFSKLIVSRMSALVISGGEPFLQQKQLIPFLVKLKAAGWWVEVETNGTVMPRDIFMELVDQVNCSPKLDTVFSGDSERLRIRPNTLKALSANAKVNFKFVISEPSDVEQVFKLVSDYSMREVRLMPECRTRDEMREKEPWVRELCERHGFIYCTRLSIELSGTKRGV